MSTMPLMEVRVVAVGCNNMSASGAQSHGVVALVRQSGHVMGPFSSLLYIPLFDDYVFHRRIW